MFIPRQLKSKKLNNMKKLISTVCIFLLTKILFAQAPDAFNYQGVARDLGGNPLSNKAIGLEIAILEGYLSGSEIYIETHAVTTSDIGLFSIQIGNGIVLDGIFEDIDWGNGNHFLQVAIDESGGNNYQIIGTSQLLSVPYALYAKNSGNWQLNNDIVNTNKRVSVGSSSSSALLTLTTNSIETYNREVLAIENLSNDNGSASRIDISAGTGSNISTANIITFSNTYGFTSGYTGYTVFSGGYNSSGLILRSQSNNGKLRFLVGGNDFNQNEKLQINSDGLIKVNDGDIFIENVNKGVIMKSANGQCWRMTISDTGVPITTSIICPD